MSKTLWEVNNPDGEVLQLVIEENITYLKIIPDKADIYSKGEPYSFSLSNELRGALKAICKVPLNEVGREFSFSLEFFSLHINKKWAKAVLISFEMDLGILAYWFHFVVTNEEIKILESLVS